MTRLEAPPSVNYVEQWIRVPEVGLVAASATSGEKVEAYKGFRSVSALSVTVEGPGSWAKGRIKGRIETYEWEKIYQVYNLPKSESADYWFINYRKDSSQSELKETNGKTVTQGYDVDFEFSIEGNAFGITSVLVGYTAIRLDYEGTTKIYTIPNPPSAGAVTPDGAPYPGGFKPA